MTPPFDDRFGDRFGDRFAGSGRRREDPPPRVFADGSFPPFPTESEWLDLPLPSSTGLHGSLSGDLPLRPRDEFVDGVMQALDHEAMLDAQLHAFDRDLPSELLQAWDVPEPAPGFVARTMAAARDDRRTHWHHLLARYVAPEPSPQFVARTLAALAALAAPDALDAGGGPGPARASRWRRIVWPLLAAAAALLLWNALGGEPKAPFELRVVRGTPAAYVQAYATSPLATVIATREHTAEPDALVEASADGVWLLTEVAR